MRKKQIKKNKNKKKYIIFISIFTTLIIFGIWYVWFRPTYDQYGLPTRLVSYEYVSSRPEAKLFYPNGKVYSPFGQAMRNNNSVAFTGAVMTSTDPPEKIYKWYHDWLLAHSWRYDEQAIGGRATTQVSIKSYSRSGSGIDSREVFYIAMDDPKSLGWVIGRQMPTNTTVFEFRYIIR
jgi:hypothetical protein